MPAVSAGRTRVSRARSTVLHSEPFLSATNLVSNSLTLGVNRPSKQGDVWSGLSIPDTGADPDWGVGYVSADQVNDTTRLWYTAFESSSINYVHLGHARTTNGSTMTRPSLGLITYDGDTTNNLVTPGSLTRNQYRVSWDETTKKYVCIVYVLVGADLCIDIYTAADPLTSGWGTRVNRLTNPFGTGYCEPMAFWRRSDGRAVIYAQGITTGHTSYGGLRRHVAMLLGASDGSLTGSWTSQGNILTSSADDRQYYHAGAWVDGPTVYVPIGIFDGTNSVPSLGTFSGTVNRIHKVALYSADASSGTTLTLVDDDWLSSTGVYDDYDGGEVIGGNSVVRSGNTWRYYFGGDGNTHHQSTEAIRHLGYTTLGYRRVGGASGSGEAITSTITAPVGGKVYVNGTDIYNVALVDTSNVEITGYTNCDSIPYEAYDHVMTWGGVAGVPAQFRVKVECLGGTVNHVEVRS